MMTEEMPPDLDEEPDIGPVYTGPMDNIATAYGDSDRPYQDLGGLARPDAYFGAIEFDCPTCQAKGKTLDFDGEKCRVWVERTEKWHVRKMPCISRIKLARARGII